MLLVLVSLHSNYNIIRAKFRTCVCYINTILYSMTCELELAHFYLLYIHTRRATHVSGLDSFSTLQVFCVHVSTTITTPVVSALKNYYI
jgi:uncharacterized membrane protein